MARCDVEGVILAAGRGSRLRPLTEATPKPLLPVCGIPIIQHQIDDLRAVGVQKIYVVVGAPDPRFLEVAAFNRRNDVDVELVLQDAPLGIAHAVSVLAGRITKPFLLLLGDSMLFPSPLAPLLARFTSAPMLGVLAAQEELDPDRMQRNFAIFAEPEGKVTAVVEKPRVAATTLKGCGAYLFDPEIFAEIARTPRSPLRNEYEITDAIGVAIAAGKRVEVWPGVLQEFNITTPRDLLECNLDVLRRSGRRVLIESNVQLAPDIHIDNAIVGGGARLPRCRSLVNSVVFSGAVLQDERSIANSLVSRECTIDVRA